MSIQDVLLNYHDIVNIGTGFARSEMMDYAIECWQYVIDNGHGNAEAYSNLGVSYYYGNGVKQDYKKAVQYYQRSAAKGHSFGMYNLAVACENGNGLPKIWIKRLSTIKWLLSMG